MLRRTSYLLVLVLLCGVAQAGISVADQPRFVGRLPQGAVELVGITRYPPSNKSEWWQPDGSPVRVGPFRPQEVYRFLVPKGSKHLKLKELTFLIRVQDPQADPSAPARAVDDRPSQGWPVWQIVLLDSSGNVDWGAYAGTGGGRRWLVDFSLYSGDTRVVDAGENTVPDYHMYHTALSASAQVGDLGVGIGKGKWETVITQTPDRAGTRTFNRDGKRWTVTFQRAYTAGTNITQIGYKTPLLHYDFYGQMAKRLLAVAQDGTVVEDASKHKEFDAGSGAVACHYLPLSSIKEYRFQVRPYYWVGFKNVSLQHGQKTDAQVVSPYDPVNNDK
jgi:hypothetical protein